jgi:hypothetical protein
MFDIFKKKKRTILPEDYSNLVDEKGYEIFLNKCLSILKNLGYNVVSFDNGDIVYEKENCEKAHFYLDNLLRVYLQADDRDKDTEIQNHFSKLKDQTKAYDYLYKDFDYAKQFLKVLLKADDILPNNHGFVYQNNYPSLLTFLVLDFEDQFHYVNRNEVSLWETDELELFEIAKENIRKEDIEIMQYNYEDKYDVFVLISGDFSASYTLLILLWKRKLTKKKGKERKKTSLVLEVKEGNTKKLFIESYGCAMNFSDSEIVASILTEQGYNTTQNLEEADLVLVNTCSIRDKAEQTIRKRLKNTTQ